MTNNLFPLPYWAPALQRVPMPLQVLNEAYVQGERACKIALWPDRYLRQVPRCARRLGQQPSPPSCN